MKHDGPSEFNNDPSVQNAVAMQLLLLSVLCLTEEIDKLKLWTNPPPDKFYRFKKNSTRNRDA